MLPWAPAAPAYAQPSTTQLWDAFAASHPERAAQAVKISRHNHTVLACRYFMKRMQPAEIGECGQLHPTPPGTPFVPQHVVLDAQMRKFDADWLLAYHQFQQANHAVSARNPAPVARSGKTPQEAAYDLCVSPAVYSAEMQVFPQILELSASGPRIAAINPGPAFADPAYGRDGAICYVTVIFSRPLGVFPPDITGRVTVHLLQDGYINVAWDSNLPPPF